MGKKVPFITSGATHPDLPKRLGQDFFMVPFGDDDQAHAIADYAREDLRVKKVAVWTDCTMDFTTALSGYFTKRFTARGGLVVRLKKLRAGDRGFSTWSLGAKGEARRSRCSWQPCGTRRGSS
jgi:branched-chain amino acid transport system substrate-binding protein